MHHARRACRCSPGGRISPRARSAVERRRARASSPRSPGRRARSSSSATSRTCRSSPMTAGGCASTTTWSRTRRSSSPSSPAARPPSRTRSRATSRAIQHLFGSRVGRDMFLYSIARTPEHDTPAALNRWAVWSGAGPGWKFLTGAPPTSRRCAAASASPPTTRPRTRTRRTPWALVRYGVRAARCAGATASPRGRRGCSPTPCCSTSAPARPARTPSSPAVGRAGGSGQAPVWNCRLLLQGVD